MERTVIIAGGGASGLMAAIAAARAGASVTVLEGMERAGKKLLITGNGRCNLTNLDPALPKRYYGTGAALAADVVGRFGAADTLAFFERLGLVTQEKNGYVYPYSGQAAAVLHVLLAELRRLRVKLKYNEKIRSVSRKDGMWEVQTETWRYTADALILACGSKAAPSTGSDGSGYALAGKLGHTVVPPRPALAPLVCRSSRFSFSALAGVRCRSRVSLYQTGGVPSVSGVSKAAAKQLSTDLGADSTARLLKTETGELQWTKYGVSGIVVFQVSRFVTPKCAGAQYLEIDLLPDFDDSYLMRVMNGRAAQLSEKNPALLTREQASQLLAGLLHEKLIPVVLKNAEAIIAEPHTQKADVIPEKRAVQQYSVGRLLAAVRHLRLEIIEPKSFDVCQVCAGGVDAREVSAENLQSKKHENLFFAGELLDVDGPCGGYNLQWAWSSGLLAGTAAAAAPARSVREREHGKK